MIDVQTAALDSLIDALLEHMVRRMVQLQLELGPRVETAGSSPWMGIEKAAAYLDLPKQRLYKLTASGEIPHFKQGGRLLFHRGDLTDWLRTFAEGGN
jgi:excisionase family DNA binding protein